MRRKDVNSLKIIKLYTLFEHRIACKKKKAKKEKRERKAKKGNETKEKRYFLANN